MQIPEKNPNEDYEFVNHSSRKPKKQISPVIGGLVLIAGGAVCSYFFIYQKLQEMKEHADSISYSIKLVMIGPALLIFGLYYLLVRPDDLNGKSASDKKWLYIFVGIFFLAMIGLYIWFKSVATGYGYSI